MKLVAAQPWPPLPDGIGGPRLGPVPLDAVTEVLLVPGRDASGAFEAAVGVPFPAVGRCSEAGEVRVLWWGREAALVLGRHVEVAGALCVDQTDAFAALGLSGGARDVLARLCPLDLRDAAMPVGATARSLLGHVAASLTRTETDAWLLVVPRTMVDCVAHDLLSAAEGVAARARHGDAVAG